MDSQYFSGNRARLYAALPAGSLLAVFSGEEIRKTSDEFYPFFAERNFVYLTGLECKQAVLLAMRTARKRCGNGYISCRPTRMPSAGRQAHPPQRGRGH